MIGIKVEIKGLAAVRATLNNHVKQVRFAAAKALTKTAHSARSEVVREMQDRLDRPTAYATKQAIQVEAATRETLSAVVGLGVKYDAPSKGTPYAKALGHLFTGGTRAWKKMERAFQRIGALPSGMMMAPGGACPLDAYGNPPRGFIVQLISYFNAFGEQGYKANMSDKRRGKLAKAGISAAGFKTISGVQYFISYGRRGRPGGDRYAHGRGDQHLPAGIWSRSGIHGSSVKPIFLFVRSGNWSRRIDLDRIACTVVSREWPSNFDAALSDALRTARP